MRKLLTIIIILAIVIVAVLFLSGDDVEAPERENINNTNENSTMKITSTAFNHEEEIPSKFTCDGENINPPLEFSGVPENAKSLVLIVDDPDVPKEVKPEQMFVHWVLYDIPPLTEGIPEDSSIGNPGQNGAEQNEYTGPCPPTQYEPTKHRYFFKLYALDTELDLRAGASKDQVRSAMNNHILDEAVLIGTYDRNE